MAGFLSAGTLPAGSEDLDRQHRAMQEALGRARANPWQPGDLLSPELAPVLGAVVAPRSTVRGHGLALPPDPALDEPTRINPWATHSRTTSPWTARSCSANPWARHS